MRPVTAAHASTLPYLTADLPGVGGMIKRYNEDFVVEELPLYAAAGVGTHVYVLIEKQGLTTLAAIQRIARAIGRQPREIGYAGLKDAHGVTRQWMSMEHIDPERVRAVEVKGLRILELTRHGNKIKLGHLAGNRFEIKVRWMSDGETAGANAIAPNGPRRLENQAFGREEPVARHGASSTCALGSDAAGRAREILGELKRRGVPNYFGPQRFGARGDNALIGLAVVRGDYPDALAWMLGRPGPEDHGGVRTAREFFDAGELESALAAWPGAFQQQKRVLHALTKSGGDAQRAWRAVDHTLRKLYTSALQSELFNRILGERIDGVDQLECGDIAWKHANGACFRVEEVSIEQPRCEAFEISPTGPLFGKRMTEPTGAPGEREAATLAEAGIAREQLVAQDGSKLDGARRALRVPLGEPLVEPGADERGDYLRLSFSLPAGAYATSVMREVCKSETAEATA